MVNVGTDSRDGKLCPNCGEYELRFTPNIGWLCSKCHYRTDK